MASPQVLRARAHELPHLTLQAQVRLVLGISPPGQPRSANRRPPMTLPIRPPPSPVGNQS